MQFVESGAVRHYFDHPVMEEIAGLVAGATADEPLPAADIYWGVHRVAPDKSRRKPRIAIQTEQLIDAQGQTQWKDLSSWSLLRSFLTFDRIIDINPSNAPYYRRFPYPLRRKLVVGPYLYPSDRPAFVPGLGPALIFFGSLNARRKAMIKDLRQEFEVTVAQPGSFGDALDTRVRRHRAVLNLHYKDGVYTEYPRLLKAMLCGKNVISEPLDDTMVPGEHYLDLATFVRSHGAMEREEETALFDRLTGHLCGSWSFAEGLRRCGL